MRAVRILLLAAFAATLNAEEVQLFVGGSPELPLELKSVSFFPDFRESRTLIMDNLYACNMEGDCEKDKTIVYKSEYCSVPFKYYVGKVNMNFKQQRLMSNAQFHLVIKSDENYKINILGLNRESVFLQQYFRFSDKRSQLLRLSFRGEEGGQLSIANPYMMIQAKPFSFYKDKRNIENFYLDVSLRVAAKSSPNTYIINDKLRICPPSNPQLTQWENVFFSGPKEKIDMYRQFFEEKALKPNDFIMAIVLNNSKFAMKFNEAFRSIDEKRMFKIGFHDSPNDCDLYFGFAFIRFFKIDFLMGFDEATGKVNLSFQTISEPGKPFGYWILGLGLFIIIVFTFYVFKTHYQIMTEKKEKERSDLEESLREV